ncbi:MAG: aminopeptidase P family protein [Bacteroidetes bacterium]|nr:MAG: aminopeptidase P family protein [Bacteroidota bacterium]
MFSSTTYTDRQQKLLNQVNSGIILIPGNDESPMNYTDNPYYFRQDSTFLYFFGIKRPGLVALLDTGDGSVTIYGDDFTVEDVVWMGNLPTIADQAALCGVEKTGSLKDLANRIKKALKDHEQIHFIPQYRHHNVLKLMKLTGWNAEQIEKGASVELINAVAAQRIYKSDEEITEIEKGVDTTIDMHVTAMKMLRPGMNELDIVVEIEKIARATGGNISFPTIATINGQTLHNHYHGNTVEEGQLFLLDCGAETPMGYAGDLSSTFPVSKTFTSLQKDIFNIVLKSHYASVDLLKPGVTNKEVHLAACLAITEGLKGMGLMKGNPEDAVEAGAHALFFPCGTGHMMGLDIHDMENLGEVYVGYDGEPKSTQFGLKSLRLGRALEPGFVLTIEPGIYFIPELTDQWRAENKFTDFLNYDEIDKFRNFGGIRNEENYLITADGHKLLGNKKKPMTVEEVEELRS